jgi:hypothetical protein
MVGHEINDSRLCPMRQIASVDLEFGFAIEKRDTVPYIYILCTFATRIVGRFGFADFQLSFRDTGGTPMLLFARPQRHPRHRAHRIIGVSPVSRIAAKGDDRKTNRQI